VTRPSKGERRLLGEAALQARGTADRCQDGALAPEGTVGRRKSGVEGGNAEGAGDGAPQKGGQVENRRPWLETLKPRGEGPMAPMPKAARHGQRGGVDGDEKGLHI